jgi:hypothetical protein
MLARLDSRALAVVAGLSIAGSSAPSEATLITYEVAAIAGNTFEYRYAVENDTLSVDIEELTVYFDVDLFENLRMPTAPTDWDPLVIQPDTVLGDDGFLDVLALGSGIPPGGSLGAFTIWADFLGPGTPGRQPFEILDPLTFTVLDSGFTVPAAGAVAEPTTLWLFGIGGIGGIGLGALALRRRVATAPSGTEGTSR